MLRIAVQSKGRLNEDTMNLLEEVGVKLSIGKRQLLTRSSNFPAEILFLRDDDIPKSVAEGIADVGIVGENEYVEKRANADIVKRLGFSNCRLSLAIPKEAKYKGLEWFNGKKIATSYPDILATFLKKNSIKAKIFIITGSVEISPELGVADAIFDIVSSGSTLVAHHLKEVEVIMESEAVMIANKQLTPLKQTIFDELLFRIEAVQEAYNKKYILMNVPNEKIKAIIDILPGMKAPTIMPLVRDGWSSLHTVLDEKRFWDIIGKLKQLGAEGILVLPIEKMIL
ncbi:MAG: ATP phosphoribosyltransferase [Paludibacteraceae bacterium]|jgi:ATP phosphoribosyltransferase|nr:ATP phosphoribosyltransferase [Paludibacteraceae bacterium]